MCVSAVVLDESGTRRSLEDDFHTLPRGWLRVLLLFSTTRPSGYYNIGPRDGF